MAFQKDSLKGYNQYSTWQLQDILAQVSDIVENLKQALSLTEGPLIIADYGCSEGYNSMILFHDVLQTFRSVSERPVHIYHDDLPDNDWVLFNNMLNTSEESYLKLPNTSYSVIGRSFYDQILPSGTVHVGFSGFAFHYLSTKISVGPGDLDEILKQSRADINTLLRHRINELAAGGTLTIVATSPGLAEEDYGVRTIFYESYNEIIKQGLVPLEVFKSASPNIHAIDLNDWSEALSNFRSEIEVLKLEPSKTLCPYYSKYLQDGDLEKLKENIAGWILVLCRLQIYNNISGPEEEKQKVLAAFREAVKNTVKPEMNYYWPIINIAIKKR
jgi:SAM dependent carboxyl methyltransferase